MAEYIERERLLRKFNIDDMMNVNGTLISLREARETISNFRLLMLCLYGMGGGKKQIGLSQMIEALNASERQRRLGDAASAVIASRKNCFGRTTTAPTAGLRWTVRNEQGAETCVLQLRQLHQISNKGRNPVSVRNRRSSHWLFAVL